jgi:4-amino-4-deoxy-L-arabinose transferase-like glycosyltransferase
MATASAIDRLGAFRQRLTWALTWSYLERLAPGLIAVLLGGWSLRGFRGTSVIGDDAPRHAMNGAFILDMVRNWKVGHPVEYGYWYYSHSPALTLPYHPPLFPAFEALLFSVFGVGTFGARLAVSIATAVAALLLFRLVSKTHGSRLLALLVTVSFFTLGTTQKLSNMVMLEIPSLVFVLAALLFILPVEDIFSRPRSLGFGILGAMSIWTKQAAVFLLPLPFIYSALAQNWKLLRRSFFWVNICILVASALGLAMLARQLNWNGMNQAWAKTGLLERLAHNSNFYLHSGMLGVVLATICLISYRLPGGKDDLRKDRLYIAWLTAALLVLVGAPAYSPRYMFFAIPAFMLLFYHGLARLGRSLLPNCRWLIPVAVCLVSVAYGLTTSRVPYLVGPSEAALFLHNNGYRRILFCGVNHSAFIFALRSDDPSLSSTVIRGDKLPDDTYLPEQLNAFISRYGIDAVVLDRTKFGQPWDDLSPELLPFLSLQRVVPMTDSTNETSGSLSLYRVLKPSKVPPESLTVPSTVLGRDLELRF